MALSHLEVLSEVLVAAPPIGPDHIETLVAAGLMEVRIAHVILLSVNREAAVSVACTMLLAHFTKSVAPVLNHAFFL